MGAIFGKSHEELTDNIGCSEEWPGWIEWLLEPKKEDFYFANIAYQLYLFRLSFRAFLGAVPQSEEIKEFKDFFVNREVPEHKASIEEKKDVVETIAQIEKKRKQAADHAIGNYIARFGIPPPPVEVKDGH